MSRHKLLRYQNCVLMATLVLACPGPPRSLPDHGVAPLPGPIYYVAPTGNDANPGTETQPWKTIQKAANTLVAGGSVYIRAGSYREMVVPRNSGTDSDHYITYAAYPGETVTIDGSGVAVPAYAGLLYLLNVNYIRVSGLHFVNSPSAGIFLESSGHILIENNYTYNTGSSGIGVWSSHDIIVDGNDIALACSGGLQESLTIAGTNTFEVKNNRIHNDNVTGYNKEGIDIKKGSTNGSVYRNLVYQTKVTGIYVDAWDMSTGNINIFQNVIHDASSGIALASEVGGLLDSVRIYNNISYNNRYAGFFLSGCCAGAASHPIRNIEIINNTFYNNGGVGIGLYDNVDVGNITVRNNILSQNRFIQIAVSGVPTNQVAVDHNLVDGNRNRADEFDGTYLVAGNPQFVNPSVADFHLSLGSPAVDKGASLDAPSEDFDGNPRPRGIAWDIGAYESAVVFTISGNAGAGDVTLNYIDGTPKTAISQSSGNYSLAVLNNWSGTVTPTHPCFTFSPAGRNYTNLTGSVTAQNYAATLNPASGCADIGVWIGGTIQGRYGITSHGSTRQSYQGVNNGLVQVHSLDGSAKLIASERVILPVNGRRTSFSELMGLPNSQRGSVYWLPWYDNVNIDSQLRFGNVSGSTAHVNAYIHGDLMPGSPFTLPSGQSTRVSFVGVNNGPVKISSDTPIVAAERLIYAPYGTRTSFTEIMGMPDAQLDTTYWLPWYNNVDLATTLRVTNASGSDAQVSVSIHGNLMPGSPFTLGTGASTVLDYPGVNDGVVKVVSDFPVVVAEQVIFSNGGRNRSLTQMMGLPNNQLDTTYWLPWYNNLDLDEQLRFGNVSGSLAHVNVYVHGNPMPGNPITLGVGQSTRISFAGVNDGVVKIVSDQRIVAAERVIFSPYGQRTSFSEMMGLPNAGLDVAYWLPWYNNVDLDEQLRFGLP